MMVMMTTTMPMHMTSFLLARSGDSFKWEAASGGPLMVAAGTKCGDGRVCLDTNCVEKDVAYDSMVDSKFLKIVMRVARKCLGKLYIWSN